MDDYYEWDDMACCHMPRKPATDATRKTSAGLMSSRPVVKDRPGQIKEPSLDEGVAFVQRMVDDGR